MMDHLPQDQAGGTQTYCTGAADKGPQSRSPLGKGDGCVPELLR